MVFHQARHRIPMTGGAPAVEQSGGGQHLRSIADRDDLGAFSVLRNDPVPYELVITRLHRRHDDIVGAIGIALVKSAGCRLRFDTEAAGIEPDRFGALGNHGHVGDVAAPEHAIGNEEVGNLGRLVVGEDRDHGSLAFRRAHRIDRFCLYGRCDRRHGTCNLPFLSRHEHNRSRDQDDQ